LQVRFGLDSGCFDEIVVNHDVDSAYDELLALARRWYPQAANGAGIAPSTSDGDGATNGKHSTAAS
jgi:hypothetical protein